MSPAGVQLRHASIADLVAIIALERSIDTAPHWPLASYAAIVESQASVQPLIATKPSTLKRCLFVAEIPQQMKIVGFAIGLLQAAEAVAELESVAVTTSARRTGIGHALCATVLDWCREQGAASVTLEVRAGSTAALALYSALGFAEAGRRPRYYRDPEDDALILRLALESQHK